MFDHYKIIKDELGAKKKLVWILEGTSILQDVIDFTIELKQLVEDLVAEELFAEAKMINTLRRVIVQAREIQTNNELLISTGVVLAPIDTTIIVPVEFNTRTPEQHTDKHDATFAIKIEIPEVIIREYYRLFQTRDKYTYKQNSVDAITTLRALSHMYYLPELDKTDA